MLKNFSKLAFRLVGSGLIALLIMISFDQPSSAQNSIVRSDEGCFFELSGCYLFNGSTGDKIPPGPYMSFEIAGSHRMTGKETEKSKEVKIGISVDRGKCLIGQTLIKASRSGGALTFNSVSPNLAMASDGGDGLNQVKNYFNTLSLGDDGCYQHPYEFSASATDSSNPACKCVVNLKQERSYFKKYSSSAPKPPKPPKPSP